MSAAPVHLVFDGHCGFCTRAAGWLRRLDRRQRVQIYPAQRPGVLERFALTENDAQKAAWAFTGRRRTAGAAAVNLVLDAALGVKGFSSFYNLPGIHWIQDRLYQWVADHRYMLRGVTPWCEEHPEDCGPSQSASGCSLRPRP
ncbi:MAG: DUF393 domain-containing protein [Actinomycetaceae bacterium]|nr:DUF393 domain-containing protein [Actinomycetaceae bacterium]